MSKNIRSIIIAVAIIVLAVIIAILINQFNLLKPQKKYAAVYLSDGQLYFGELCKFPRMTLKNIYIPQTDKEGNLSLQKFSNLFWKPKEPMHLNDKQVVSWTLLDSSSPIIDALEGKVQPTSQQDQPPETPESPTNQKTNK
jgi:hypothetical protein